MLIGFCYCCCFWFLFPKTAVFPSLFAYPCLIATVLIVKDISLFVFF